MRGRCWNPKVVQWGLSPISNNNHNLCQVVTCRSLGISVEPKEHMTQREVSFRYLLHSEKNNTRLLVLGQGKPFLPWIAFPPLSTPSSKINLGKPNLCSEWKKRHQGREMVQSQQHFSHHRFLSLRHIQVKGRKMLSSWFEIALNWIRLGWTLISEYNQESYVFLPRISSSIWENHWTVWI